MGHGYPRRGRHSGQRGDPRHDFEGDPGRFQGQRLLAAGLAAETPAAAVSRGTLPDQEVVRTTLEHFASATAELAGPTLLVIGDVAALELLPSTSPARVEPALNVS